MFHVVKNKEKNFMGFPVHIANFVVFCKNILLSKANLLFSHNEVSEGV